MVKVSERIKIKPLILVMVAAGVLTPLTNLAIIFGARYFFKASLLLQGPDMPSPERLPVFQMLPEGLVVSILFSLLLLALCRGKLLG